MVPSEAVESPPDAVEGVIADTAARVKAVLAMDAITAELKSVRGQKGKRAEVLQALAACIEADGSAKIKVSTFRREIMGILGDFSDATKVQVRRSLRFLHEKGILADLSFYEYNPTEPKIIVVKSDFVVTESSVSVSATTDLPAEPGPGSGPESGPGSGPEPGPGPGSEPEKVEEPSSVDIGGNEDEPRCEITGRCILNEEKLSKAFKYTGKYRKAFLLGLKVCVEKNGAVFPMTAIRDEVLLQIKNANLQKVKNNITVVVNQLVRQLAKQGIAEMIRAEDGHSFVVKINSQYLMSGGLAEVEGDGAADLGVACAPALVSEPEPEPEPAQESKPEPEQESKPEPEPEPAQEPAPAQKPEPLFAKDSRVYSTKFGHGTVASLTEGRKTGWRVTVAFDSGKVESVYEDMLVESQIPKPSPKPISAPAPEPKPDPEQSPEQEAPEEELEKLKACFPEGSPVMHSTIYGLCEVDGYRSFRGAWYVGIQPVNRAFPHRYVHPRMLTKVSPRVTMHRSPLQQESSRRSGGIASPAEMTPLGGQILSATAKDSIRETLAGFSKSARYAIVPAKAGKYGDKPITGLRVSFDMGAYEQESKEISSGQVLVTAPGTKFLVNAADLVEEKQES